MLVSYPVSSDLFPGQKMLLLNDYTIVTAVRLRLPPVILAPHVTELIGTKGDDCVRGTITSGHQGEVLLPLHHRCCEKNEVIF